MNTFITFIKFVFYIIIIILYKMNNNNIKINFIKISNLFRFYLTCFSNVVVLHTTHTSSPNPTYTSIVP